MALPPRVLLPSDIDKSNCTVPLQNASQKEKTIPKGTVIAQIHKAGVVTGVAQGHCTDCHIDPKFFLFWRFPLPQS